VRRKLPFPQNAKEGAAGAKDMVFQGLGRFPELPCFAQIDNGVVLMLCASQPVGVRQLHSSESIRGVQKLDRGSQHLWALGVTIEGRMKLYIQIAPAVHMKLPEVFAVLIQDTAYVCKVADSQLRG